MTTLEWRAVLTAARGLAVSHGGPRHNSVTWPSGHVGELHADSKTSPNIAPRAMA